MVAVFWCSSSHKRKAPEDDDQPVVKRKTPDTWRYAYKMLKVMPSCQAPFPRFILLHSVKFDHSMGEKTGEWSLGMGPARSYKLY